jgi:hypothetical protein
MVGLKYLAYLDPATGSTLFQLAVASFLSMAAAVRLNWRRLRSLMSRRRGESSGPQAGARRS